MIQIKKTILTLVALLAVTTGAWAQTETLLVTINSTDNTSFKSGNKTFDDIATVTFSGEVSNDADNWGWYFNLESGKTITVTAASDAYTITRVKFYTADGSAFDEEAPFEAIVKFEDGYIAKVNGTSIGHWGVNKIEVYGAAASAASGPEVAWNKAEKSGTFTMPGGNVTLEPEYYPQATVAEGAVTAADADARATTDDPLVKVDATKLTGAKKLMYFVSNSGTTAPAYDAEGWTDQLPTAEGFTQQGIVYVWYYPVGTDEGVDGATATYSDGDICLQSITARIAAEPTYAVTFADDTAEPTLWKANPATDVKKGETVTVTYTGQRKVMGVKAEKKAAAAAAKDATAEDLGKLIGADGNIYDTKAAAEAANTTAVAMIAYVGSSTDNATYTHGLAIALADEEGQMNWNPAKSTCEGKSAVTNAAWQLPSQNQWKAMFKAFGDNDASYSGLNTAITNAGGTALMGGNYYWSTTPDEGHVFCVSIDNGNDIWQYGYVDEDSYCVRACLAF